MILENELHHNLIEIIVYKQERFDARFMTYVDLEKLTRKKKQRRASSILSIEEGYITNLRVKH